MQLILSTWYTSETDTFGKGLYVVISKKIAGEVNYIVSLLVKYIV